MSMIHFLTSKPKKGLLRAIVNEEYSDWGKVVANLNKILFWENVSRGRLPTFTSNWLGPYDIVTKVLYEKKR